MSNGTDDRTAEAAFELRPYADRIFAAAAATVADNAAKAAILARLSRDATIYAARGDRRGISIAVGRAAAEIQDAKLDTEGTIQTAFEIAGEALVAAAEIFVPRLVGALLRGAGG